jgi:hypothetical protein
MAELKKLTFGQKRVLASFNPSQNTTVDQIKNKSAELIDLLESLRVEEATGEKHRLISIAQTDIETACMYGTKANFVK